MRVDVVREYMNEKIQTTAKRLVTLLVAHDFAGLEEWSQGVRLKREQMAKALNQYPGYFVMPPEPTVPYLDVVEVIDSSPKQWSVDIPLWTQEEGRSDLTMQVTMIESENEMMNVEIDDIHVL